MYNSVPSRDIAILVISTLLKTCINSVTKCTGGDNSNKGCFGRKTNLFRESGDFAGNRETWEIFREI